jgi:hypothetical protein
LITKSIAIENDSEIELNYEEYKSVNKEIMIPHSIYSNYDGFSLKEVQLNPNLSEEIFKPKAL